MTDKILEVRGLTKTYGGDKKKGAKQPTPTLDVLKGIDIDIYRGDVVCLIGPSGCGKSTFLRCLNRLEIPTGGSIKFEGVEIDDSHIDAVRQKMGMVFQHFNLFPHLTVKQNLCLAPTLLKLKNQQEADKRAEELLARVGLSDKADAYPKSLSGGQQQRIAIARALATPASPCWSSPMRWALRARSPTASSSSTTAKSRRTSPRRSCSPTPSIPA